MDKKEIEMDRLERTVLQTALEYSGYDSRHNRDRLNAAVTALRLGKSPLPTSSELSSHLNSAADCIPHLHGGAYWGVYWLKWAAEREGMSIKFHSAFHEWANDLMERR